MHTTPMLATFHVNITNEGLTFDTNMIDIELHENLEYGILEMS